MTRSYLFRPALLLVALLAFSACGGSDASSPEGLVIKPVSASELIDEVRAAEAEFVVVNFWASWCLPCREEFPAFVRYGRDADPEDVQVQFVSVDFEEDLPHAAQFLREHGIDGTTYVKDGKEGAFISEINPDWSGAIPATAVYDRTGSRVAFWEGMVSYDQLARRIDDLRASS